MPSLPLTLLLPLLLLLLTPASFAASPPPNLLALGTQSLDEGAAMAGALLACRAICQRMHKMTLDLQCVQLTRSAAK